MTERERPSGATTDFKDVKFRKRDERLLRPEPPHGASTGRKLRLQISFRTETERTSSYDGESWKPQREVRP